MRDNEPTEWLSIERVCTVFDRCDFPQCPNEGVSTTGSHITARAGDECILLVFAAVQLRRGTYLVYSCNTA